MIGPLYDCLHQVVTHFLMSVFVYGWVFLQTHLRVVFVFHVVSVVCGFSTLHG